MFGFGGSIGDAFSGAVNAAADAVASGIGAVGNAYSAGKDAHDAAQGGRGGGPSPSSPAGGAQAAGGYTDGSRGGGDGASNYSGPSPSSPAGGAQAAAGYSGGGRDAPSSYSGISGAIGGKGGGNAATSSATPTGFAPSLSGGIGAALGGSANSLGPSTYGPAWSASAATPTGFTPSARSAEIASMTALGQLSPSRPDNYAASGPKGMGGLGGLYVGAVPGVAQSATTWDRVIDQIVHVESRGKANAANPLSSARGAGQFIADTWVDMMSRHAPGLIAGKSRQEVLDMRYDPALARQMTNNYAVENARALQAKGLPVTPGSVYLSHFLGPVAAQKALAAAPSTPIANLVTPQAVQSNRSILSGKTTGEVIAWADRKMSGGPTISQTPAAGPIPESRPDFSAKYLDAPLPSVVPAANREWVEHDLYGRTREEARTGVVPAGAAPAGRGPSTAAMVATAPTSTQAASSAPPSTMPSTQVVTVEPSQAVATSSETMAGKIMAGGIDVLAGLAPGIGPAVGAVNLGLSLTGNRTVGQRAVDWLGNLEGEGGKMTGGTDGPNVPDLVKEEESTIPEPPRDFASKYLLSSAVRPKPRERWGRAA